MQDLASKAVPPTIWGMRLAVLIACFASPAVAWEFQPFPICTLVQDTDEATISVTHNPRRAEPFAIELDLKTETWVPGPQFTLSFDGPARRIIGTARHQLSQNDSRLTVTDTGFDNVLAGIALNFVALARLGEKALVIPLQGAKPQVDKFIDCLSDTSI